MGTSEVIVPRDGSGALGRSTLVGVSRGENPNDVQHLLDVRQEVTRHNPDLPLVWRLLRPIRSAAEADESAGKPVLLRGQGPSTVGLCIAFPPHPKETLRRVERIQRLH